jgi:hypothetical protein
VATSTNEPYQISEDDWSFWIVPMPDGTYAVESYIKPGRTVLNGLTKEQAEALQVYLTELMESYGNRDKVMAELGKAAESGLCFLLNTKRNITLED